MKLPNNLVIPKHIRPSLKKTRFWVDNEIIEKYGPKLKSSGIAIYCTLARHANSKTQSCFPSYPTIMKFSGIGKRNTVSKYIKIIEELGLILVLRNKKRQPNIYFLMDPLNTKKDSIQMYTVKKEYSYDQKENEQYLNSKGDSTEKDTGIQLTKSNKERENSSLKEEDSPFVQAMRANKPSWLN
ncbi:helix-turn-helix domain-containing protein [Candidatus Nomurabacteria bacterium]|nr:helix-turn-helix domain-containing protein [Candidatus Nomurabacteria bacterium]